MRQSSQCSLENLCRNDGENVEEWMGRLKVAAIKCNYHEVDRQLKEQFIHSLNDKNMLEEIIKELMTVRGDEQIMSGNVLAWVKRVEAQMAQAAVSEHIYLNQRIQQDKSVQTSMSKQPKSTTTV